MKKHVHHKLLPQQIKSWLDNNCNEYHNYCTFKKDAKEWFYALELDSDAEDYFDEIFDKMAEAHFINEIERKYGAMPFGVGLGISHINTPYKYFVEFVEADVSTIDELKRKIQNHTTPYAFGTLSSGSWGNFWFEIVDDFERIKKEHNQYYYMTFLCVLATHGNHT